MAPWRIRDFHDDDLDAAVRLWEDRPAGTAAPVFGVSDLIAAVRAGAPAVVAVVGEDLVGTVVATLSGDRAWLMRISLAPAWRKRGIGSAMLTELERRLVAGGVHRVTCLLADEAEMGALALEHCGYTARREMIFYERLEPVGPADVGILERLGGRMIRANTWDQLGGMAREKELIERRVILPLANPQLADRLGLVPPRAVILFGPPGTGKTTFAKGVASRLGWPFAELFPSRLAGDSPAGLASALREAFALVAELDKVVVFIDEVEEIAGLRQPRTVSVAQGVTNEMLKLIPPFRERDERLLICATNSVRDLDTAFLRHGRFDYLIPVGPPDEQARQAIWDRYLAAMPHAELDMNGDRRAVPAVHPGRHRVRRPPDRPAGVRAGHVRARRGTHLDRGRPARDRRNAPHPDPGHGHPVRARHPRPRPAVSRRLSAGCGSASGYAGQHDGLADRGGAPGVITYSQARANNGAHITPVWTAAGLPVADPAGTTGAERRFHARWRRVDASYRVSPGSWPDFARIADYARMPHRRCAKCCAHRSPMYGREPKKMSVNSGAVRGLAWPCCWRWRRWASGQLVRR